MFFVLSLVTGLALTGYCAFLFVGNLNETATADKEYQDNLGQYTGLQQQVPYPSTQNIQRAQTNLSVVKEFQTQFHKAFAGYPTPPTEDEKGFSGYLEETIAGLKTKATNASVGLPETMGFGFSDWRGKLNYPMENIPMWMQQLAEIKSLCDILFQAKINSIAVFRRVSVSPTDMIRTADDTFPASISGTVLGTNTPYKIEFRCFTRGLTAVMEGLARASNCFVVKNIVVMPAEEKPTTPPPPAAAAPVATASPVAAPPPPPPPSNDPLASRRARLFPGTQPPAAPARPTVGASSARSATASGPFVPPTVLQEHLLYITISVDAAKFN
jgi:hypothetical protein